MKKQLIMKQGNLLEDNSEILINTVNCVGVMGKGVALDFKKAFPQNFAEYKKTCARRDLKPGVYLHAPKQARYTAKK